MHKVYKLFTKSEFLRNSSILVGGTSFSAIIQILASPVLTRLYSPEEFGIFALFFSIVTFLSIIITAQYELTIVLPKDDTDSAILVLVSMIISCIFSAVLLCVVIVFVRIFESSSWLYFVPPTCLFMGLFQSGYYWLIRQKHFRILAKVSILHALITVITTVLLVFVLHGYLGLIMGYMVGYLVIGALILIITYKKIKNHWAHIARFSILLYFMKRYKNFPLYSSVSGLIDNLALQLPTFFLSAFFGTTVVGFYAISQRAVRLPISIISKAIGDVFRQKASFEYAHKGQCKELFVKVLLLLSFLAVVFFLIFFITVPYVFDLVLGKEWIIAGKYARILSAMFFLHFIAAPLGGMFIIAEKQKVGFFMRVCLLIASSASLWCGYYFFNSINACLILLTISYCMKYLFELFISYKFSLGIKLYKHCSND